MISRILHFVAHGDWKFLAAASALALAFLAIIRFVHVGV
jgi:hypothetical protein